MKEDQRQFLNLLGHPPARLTAKQVSWVLQCQTSDIPTLIAARLLKPLGDPSPNAAKYFATSEFVKSLEDRNWLNRITLTIQEYWVEKNRRRARSDFPLLESGTSKLSKGRLLQGTPG